MINRLLDGRYQVTRVLGAGGFSHTYLASDTRIPGHPTCVVKHLKPASSDPEYLQTAKRLFAKEAEILAKLGDRDHIPRLLAYFEEDLEFYLVQEFVEGDTLTPELPPGKRWSESEVIQMLQEVLGILVFVHSQGVIHRDIKPSNIIRRASDNKLVLIDFGAIKQISTLQVTETGQANSTVAIGTPGYMPTEQAQGRPRPNSDIYALGIIGIKALTGLHPNEFQEDVNTGEIIWQNLVSASPKVVEVLTKMTRYHFKDRYQTATEVLQALQQLTLPYTRSPIPATILPARQPNQQLSSLSPSAPVSLVCNKLLLIGVGVAAIVSVVAGLSYIQTVTNVNPRSTPSPRSSSPSPSVCDSSVRIVDDGEPNTTGLNVRSGPGTDNPILDTLENETRISVVGEYEGWLEISSPVVGWVAGNRTKPCREEAME